MTRSKKLLVTPSYQSEIRYDTFFSDGTFDKEESKKTRTLWDVAWECATFMRIVCDNPTERPSDENSLHRWIKQKASAFEIVIFQLLSCLLVPDYVRFDTKDDLLIVQYRRSTWREFVDPNTYVKALIFLLKQTKPYILSIDSVPYWYMLRFDGAGFRPVGCFLRVLFFDLEDAHLSGCFDCYGNYPVYFVARHNYATFLPIFENVFRGGILFSGKALEKKIRRILRQTCFPSAKVEPLLHCITSYIFV